MTTPPTPDAPDERDQIRAAIAVLEGKGLYGAELASLKSSLMYYRSPGTPEQVAAREAEVASLRERIDELDQVGRYSVAAPLKTQLAHMFARL